MLLLPAATVFVVFLFVAFVVAVVVAVFFVAPFFPFFSFIFFTSLYLSLACLVPPTKMIVSRRKTAEMRDKSSAPISGLQNILGSSRLGKQTVLVKLCETFCVTQQRVTFCQRNARKREHRRRNHLA